MTQHRRNTLRSAGAAALITCLLPLGACSKGEEAEAPSLTQAKKREPTKVLVEPAVRREMVRRLETTTRVESEHEVLVYPRMTGVVTHVLVEEGDQATIDQVLARLDDREAMIERSDAQSALLSAEAELPKLALAIKEAESLLRTAQNNSLQAERDHERNLAISENREGGVQLLSAKDVDASKLAMDQARGQLESTRLAVEKAIVDHESGARAIERAQLAVDRAQLALSYMEITAPISGTIAARTVDVGDTLTARGGVVGGEGQAAFTITDPERLRAVFYRPQRELRLFQQAPTGRIVDGDANGGPEPLEITATADGLEGVVFSGWIDRVSPTVDPASGNFRVTARVEVGEAPYRLLAGMLVRLEIVTERHPDAIVVPKRAIRREGDRTILFVAEDGVAHLIEVEEGFADGNDVEVFAPAGGWGERALEEGDLVVVVGNRDLEQGTEVTLPSDRYEETEPGRIPPEVEEQPASEDAEAQ